MKNAAFKNTLSLIIVFIIIICAFQMVCYIRHNQRQHQKVNEGLQRKALKKRKRKIKRIEDGLKYKTPNSVTRRERGISFIPGSHQTQQKDMDSFRTASKDVAMGSVHEDFKDSFECRSRSAFQPPAKTASRDSVI